MRGPEYATSNQQTKTCFSSFSVTQEDIHGESKSPVNGISAWSSKAIAGRGVLVDFYEWAQEHEMQFDTLAASSIPLSTVKQIISEKGIELKAGDILFLRTGKIVALIFRFIKAWSNICVVEEQLRLHLFVSFPDLFGARRRRSKVCVAGSWSVQRDN
jgi:hypothetical protein